MTVYVKENCGRCGALLRDWSLDYRGIGEPFSQCPTCGTFNSRAHKVTEWDLRDGFRKFTYLLWMCYLSLAYGVVVFLLMMMVALSVYPELEEQSVTALSLFGYWFVASLPVAAYLFYRVFAEIRKSRARMVDSKYRGLLVRAGNLVE